MNMVPVSSSNLNAVGYDTTTGRLVIQFHSGTYEYVNVPMEIYKGLMSANSLGQYHHQYIKYSFQYNKIR